jgi:Ca2+-binding RTX toxin-like protein
VGRTLSLNGGAGDDRLVGGDGNDFIYEDVSEMGDDVMIGGRGNDSLVGGHGHDKLYGGRGKDAMMAKDSLRDFVDGGAGVDTFEFDHGLDVIRHKP